jgi:hypothetical protein
MFDKLYRKIIIRDIFWLTVLWVGAAILVDPRGNFPLNDDFSYGKTVMVLLKEGIYQPTRWPGMPLISHVLWGALFCAFFGFSFTTLRISMLIMGLIGIVFVYLIFCFLDASRHIAFGGALILAFNPLYFALSNSFMTDVTFITLSIVSILFFIMQLKNDSNSAFVFGVIFSVLNVMCRQFGLLIPFTFAIAYTIRNGISRRTLLHGWTAFLGGCSALLVYQWWLHQTGIAPYYFNILHDLTAHSLFWLVRFGSRNIIYFLLYIGLCMIPFAILFPLPFHRLKIRRAWIVKGMVFSLILLIAFYMIRSRHLMPMVLNIVNASGMGPINLRDTDILFLPNAHPLSLHFWRLITLIGVAGAVWLAGHLWLSSKCLIKPMPSARKDYRTAVLIFILGYAILYLLCMIWTIFVDRYILSLIPLLAFVVFLYHRMHDKRWSGIRSLSMLCMFIAVFFSGLFSIAATRDYLTTNRIRWHMLRHLMEQKHVSPDRIDGGFEFNGWYLYAEKRLRLWDGSYIRKRDKSWWWVVDDEYLMAMGPVEGYEAVDKKEFKRWSTLKKQAIYCLHRKR